MQNFSCKVLTPQGQVAEIKVRENDKISCMKKLKRNGITPISIEPSFNILQNKKSKKITATIHSRKKKKSFLLRTINDIELFNKVSIEEIKDFTEDLYALRKSNFSTKHSLLTIINKTENPIFRECLKNVLSSVEGGKYLYKAMKEHKDIFPLVYINLIKTGELTKSLDESLKHAITYLEDEQKIKKKVKNILLPNILSFFGIIIMLILAILIVIPNLQNILMSYGTNIKMPRILSIISSVINGVIRFWYIWLLIIIGFGIWFVKYINSENGKIKIDSFKYNNRLVGKLLYLLDFSRVIRSIFLNLQNKMRIQDALEISKNVTKNTYMFGLIEKSINNVYVGKSWLDVFSNEKLLNPIILELLKKSEKTNAIQDFTSALKYLDKDIEKEINKVLKKLPEISYIFVGLALLLFVVTVLIPCMQIYLSGLLFI